MGMCKAICCEAEAKEGMHCCSYHLEPKLSTRNATSYVTVPTNPCSYTERMKEWDKDCRTAEEILLGNMEK